MLDVFSPSKKRGIGRDLRSADGDMSCAVINVLFGANIGIKKFLSHGVYGLWRCWVLLLKSGQGWFFLSMEPQQVLDRSAINPINCWNWMLRIRSQYDLAIYPSKGPPVVDALHIESALDNQKKETTRDSFFLLVFPPPKKLD